MKRRNFLSVGILGAVILLAGELAWTAPRQPQASSGAMEIALAAPTGVKSSIEQLAPGFEAKTGYKINGTYAASGQIKMRVINGDPFDVPILLEPIADAIASGNIVESSVKRVATVPIALAVKKGAPRPDISTPDALKRALLAAKAIAYPHGVQGAASGVSIDDTLKKLGIADQVLPKVKVGGVAMVVKGDADIALAFQNEINDPGVDVVGPLPESVSTPIPVVITISSHAKNPEAAKALLEYLSTPAAKAVYKMNGMVPAR